MGALELTDLEKMPGSKTLRSKYVYIKYVFITIFHSQNDVVGFEVAVHRICYDFAICSFLGLNSVLAQLLRAAELSLRCLIKAITYAKLCCLRDRLVLRSNKIRPNFHIVLFWFNNSAVYVVFLFGGIRWTAIASLRKFYAMRRN